MSLRYYASLPFWLVAWLFSIAADWSHRFDWLMLAFSIPGVCFELVARVIAGESVKDFP